MSSQETLVLCYHNVVEDETPPDVREAQLAVARSGFAAQLRYLMGRHRITTFEDIERGNGGRDALVLTFDDGYRGVLDFVRPLVIQYGISVSLFVNPAFVGGWNPRDKLMGLALYGSPEAVRRVEEFLGVTINGGELRERARRFVMGRTQMWRAIAQRGESSIEEVDALFARHADKRVFQGLEPSRLLGWGELAALQQEGFRIGNHGLRHLELDVLPREVIRAEIRRAQEQLRQQLGRDEGVISYPRGKTSRLVLDEVSAAGYRWGLTTVPGRINDDRPTLVTPRVVVPPRGGVPELVWKTSGVRLWARARLKRAEAS